jgi:hypothetical protein
MLYRACAATLDLASVSTTVRSVSNNVRRTPSPVSANVRRKVPFIARRAVHHCAPLHLGRPATGNGRRSRTEHVAEHHDVSTGFQDLPGRHACQACPRQARCSPVHGRRPRSAGGRSLPRHGHPDAAAAGVPPHGSARTGSRRADSPAPGASRGRQPADWPGCRHAGGMASGCGPRWRTVAAAWLREQEKNAIAAQRCFRRVSHLSQGGWPSRSRRASRR